MCLVQQRIFGTSVGKSCQSRELISSEEYPCGILQDIYGGGIVRLVYRYGAHEGETGRYWVGALGLLKLLVWHDMEGYSS